MNRISGERESTGDGDPATGDGRRRFLSPEAVVLPVLRGLAQVDFMPSALCGVFFAAALFAAGWRYGLAGLAGSAVATLTAAVWGVRADRVTA
ncbi:MAG: urea transporter, partial [Nocardiaceae bacterium]|nr:urea transporter [Nocardiaceae bacterium]